MKASLKLITALSILLFAISCGKDDEAPVNPIVGKWKLKEITFVNAPTGFVPALVSDESESSIWGEDSYTMEFFSDGTYERELNNIFQGGGLDDSGSWELDDDDLDLDADLTETEELPFSFTVTSITGDRKIILATKDLWLAWPESIVNDPKALDTLETEELSDFFGEYGAIVEFDVSMDFRKVQ